MTMTQEDIQAKLSQALRGQAKAKSTQIPILAIGSAVAIAVLAGVAFLFWPVGDALEILAADRAGVEADLKRMTASVSEADKEAYQSGFIILLLDRYPPAKGLDGFARLSMVEPALDAAHENMQGVTVADIVAAGRANLDRIEAGKVEAAQAVSQKELLVECLQSRLPVTNASVVRGPYERILTFTVANNLPWAISGVLVAYDITSKGRTVPWSSDNGSQSIAGGLEPGETKELTYPLSLFPSDAPDDLSVVARVVDVGDSQQRQLVRDVHIVSWSDELSDQTCE